MAECLERLGEFMEKSDQKKKAAKGHKKWLKARRRARKAMIR